MLATSWLPVGVLSLVVLAGPFHTIFRTKEDQRNMDCRRITQAEAHKKYPGLIPEPPPRVLAGTTREVMICGRRFVRLGQRRDRDEVILTRLRETTSDIVRAAIEQAEEARAEEAKDSVTHTPEEEAEPAPLTWYVDAFYPSLEVSAKIAVAARTELAERGERVSDRVPLLAAGDIVVLSRLPPEESYAIACKRYFAENVLTDNDAFLGLMIVDARETQLHAGVCVGGQWRWFR